MPYFIIANINRLWICNTFGKVIWCWVGFRWFVRNTGESTYCNNLFKYVLFETFVSVKIEACFNNNLVIIAAILSKRLVLDLQTPCTYSWITCKHNLTTILFQRLLAVAWKLARVETKSLTHDHPICRRTFVRAIAGYKYKTWQQTFMIAILDG